MEAEVQREMSDEQKTYLQENLATAGFVEGDAMSKSNRIREGLEKNISEKSKNKIYSLLNEVNRLSDIEKLLLCLKLPTGVTSSPVTTSETSFHRDEHQKALRWLKTHLEEDSGACVQKQELYDQYREHCESHKYKYVNQFDFGKLLRHLFPNLKLRHLGQRGQSKTCYGGLKNCSHLKPLTIPKLEISEDLSLNVNQSQDEDHNITKAACQLVCEWAEKLFGNQQFKGIQDLSEHLISNCVVSSNSTAAFTIIAAAHKEDRQIFPDNQDPEPSKSNGSEGASTSKSVLQPKTQLQLQRTLKGRKNLREQREKMEGHLGEPKSSKPADGGTPGNETEIHKVPESKPSPVVKKMNTSFSTQKQILPKCSVVTQVLTNQSNNNAVMSSSTKQSLSGTPTTPITPGNTVPQPVFVLPSQVISSKQSKVHQNSPLLKPQQMFILSPVNNNNNNNIKSNEAVSFTKENPQCGKKAAIYRSQNASVQNHPLVSGTSQPGPCHSGLSKANSKLAMLLTEDKTDNSQRRLLEKALKHKDSQRLLNGQGQKTETQLPLRHLKTNELQRLISDGGKPASPITQTSTGQKTSLSASSIVQQSSMISSGHQSPAILQNTTVLPLASGINRVLIPVNENKNECSQASVPNSSTSIVAPTSSMVNALTNGKNKKKATPVKPRHSSKTVSTLLKETRGYGPQTECKGFVNDRRPVAQLLKESRNRKLSTESPGTPPGTKTTSAALTQTTTTTPLMVQSVTVSGPVLPVGVSYNDSSSSPDVISSMMMAGNCTGLDAPQSSRSLEVAHTRMGSLAGTVAAGETVSAPATACHSGHTQLPLLDPPPPSSTANTAGCTEAPSGLPAVHSGKDPFTCFGKEPIMPGSELMMSMGSGRCPDNPIDNPLNQDGNNNQGYQVKLESGDSSNDSKELTINMDSMEGRTTTEYNLNTGGMAPEPSVNVNVNNMMDMKVSISNLEKDALTDYLGTELATDLADITPSLTIDGNSACQNQQERAEFISGGGMPAAVTELNSMSASQILLKRALVAENRNPFMSQPDVQQQNLQQVVNRVERMSQNSLQRPSSELVQYNPETCTNPAGAAVERPSTMPPELDATKLVQNLFENHQLSISVQDQNSRDSVVGYNPGQATPSSQLIATRSPSYCSMGSAPSTPSSLMSPPERFPHSIGSSEPTNSFMPIHGGSTPSTGTVPLDQVSPIRPMVTLARKLANGSTATQTHNTCNKNNNMGARVPQMNSFPRLSNPAADSNINYESSFVPYSMSDTPSTYSQSVVGSHQQQADQSQPVNDFLPASSIRPVKRPMAGAQTGGRKRVRHRSAQDAQSLAKAQAKKATKFNMLTNLLKAGVNTSQPLQGIRLNNPISSNRPCNLPKPLVINNNGQNLSNPQSPFSPEMQDIMTGDGQTAMESQESVDLNTGIFRSHSVPAQSLQRAGLETQDLVPTGVAVDQPAEEYLKEGSHTEIFHLIQDKLQEQSAAQRATQATVYNEFSARRNINNLLQEDSGCGKWGYTDTSSNSQYRTGIRGDHMISGASVRSNQALLNHQALQLALAQRLHRSISYPEDGVPTPPSSQNPTPDFSSELSTLADPTGAYCMGRGAASTVMDTPNSLDPLTTGDSQESLKDDMLADIYKESPDMAIQASLTPNQEVWPVREACPQWPQT